jgi:hypothetical protein
MIIGSPMKRRIIILTQGVLPLLVLAQLGWIWHHSLHQGDYFYRLAPTSTGTVMRGFGSYKGALLLGSIADPAAAMDNAAHYRHEAFPITGKGSMVRPRPTYKVSGLGFGVSRGELTLHLPFGFTLPTRTYQVLYVPYYFLMLLVAIAPGRFALRTFRARRQRDSCEPS